MVELSAEAQDVLDALETADMGPGEPLPLHVVWAQVLDHDAVARGIEDLERAGLVTRPDEMSLALTEAGQDRIRARSASA